MDTAILISGSIYWRSRENPLCFSAPRSGLGDERPASFAHLCSNRLLLVEMLLFRKRPIELAEAQDVYAWVSHQAVQNEVDAQAMPLTMVKGKSGPVQVYALS